LALHDHLKRVIRKQEKSAGSRKGRGLCSIQLIDGVASRNRPGVYIFIKRQAKNCFGSRPYGGNGGGQRTCGRSRKEGAETGTTRLLCGSSFGANGVPSKDQPKKFPRWKAGHAPLKGWGGTMSGALPGNAGENRRKYSGIRSSLKHTCRISIPGTEEGSAETASKEMTWATRKWRKAAWINKRETLSRRKRSREIRE